MGGGGFGGSEGSRLQGYALSFLAWWNSARGGLGL